MKKIFEDLKNWFAADDGPAAPYEAIQHDPMDPPFAGLSNFLNFAAFDPKTLLFKLDTQNGKKPEQLGVGFVIEVNPILGADDDTMQRLSSLIALLPENANLQLQMFGTPDIRQFLHAYENIQASRPESDPRRPVFQKLALRRTKVWAKGSREVLFKGTTVRLRNLRCILAVVVPSASFDNRHSIDQVVSLKERMATSLQSSNMFARHWNANDLLRWVSMLLNPYRMFVDQDTTIEPSWDEHALLRDQLIEPHTTMKVLDNGNGIRFDSKEESHILRCYSVKDYPIHFHLAGMGALIGDAIQPNLNYTSPFLISMNLYKPAYDSKKNSIQLQAARATQMAESQMGKILPDLKKRKENLDICMASYLDAGGLVMLFHQVLLWEKADLIDLAESHAESIWKTRGFSIYRDQYLQLPSLLTALPLSLDKNIVKYSNGKKRWTTKTATNAVAFAPVIGEWSGNGPPVIGLIGTRGQAMGIDVFTNPAGGYNAAIVGGTGSGKSFLVNDLVRSYLGYDSQVWIIDVGRSYEKFCQIIGGQYIEFSETSNIVIAPFELVTDIDEDVQLLKLIFSLMCSPSAELTAYQNAALEKIILDLWVEKGNRASVDDLQDWLLKATVSGTKDRDYEITRLGDQLFPFTSKGTYGKFFNGTTTLNFTDDLVVLELEELQSKPELQQVIMQLIIYRIMQAMYLSRNRRKIAIIDEAWALLGGSKSTAKFIEEGYRRVRKYKGSFMTATQSINDYYASAAAKATLTNSHFIFHLRANEDSINALEEHKPFPVSEGTLQRIRSLSKTDNYSEVYVYTSMGTGVGRLISDPFNVLVSSSKAEDFEAVRNYTKQGMDTEQAVERVLLDRGVSGE